MRNVQLCFIIIFLSWIQTVASSGNKSLYSGDKVLQISTPDQESWDIVKAMLENDLRIQDFDIWRPPDYTGSCDIHVTSDEFPTIIKLLKVYGIKYSVLIDDIGRKIKEEENLVKRTKRETRTKVVGRYARYDEILQWQADIVDQYSGNASLISIGNSYESRKMQVLKIGGPGQKKWKVWLDGGLHAREWIAPATIIYMAHLLLQGYVNDEELQQMLDTIDVYILPVANPDGYEYTHETDRLWRKNRTPSPGSDCLGVDLNRNWDYQWGGVNSDERPCSPIYKGPKPNSEPEVHNIVNFLLPQADDFIAYLSYHSYSQKFLTRWAYGLVYPPDNGILIDLAERATEAIVAKNSVRYKVGSSPELLYPFAGGSADWAKGTAKILYSYLIELRDLGENGFLLPEQQIKPTAEENLEGLKEIMREILTVHGAYTSPETPRDLNYTTTDDILSEVETNRTLS